MEINKLISDFSFILKLLEFENKKNDLEHKNYEAILNFNQYIFEVNKFEKRNFILNDNIKKEIINIWKNFPLIHSIKFTPVKSYIDLGSYTFNSISEFENIDEKNYFLFKEYFYITFNFHKNE